MKWKRILVALDASPHSLAALEGAAAIAAHQEAELTGIFVEDRDLLRLAGLPFARELIYPDVLGRPLDATVMKARLKEVAELSRQALSEAALQAGVSWSFLVRHGIVLNEILAAAGETDLLVLGKASHLEKRRRVRLGTTAATLLVQAPRTVLVVQHGEHCGAPALLVCDGSPHSLEILPAAFATAMLFGRRPTLLLFAQNRDKAAIMKREIEERLKLKDLRFRRCSPTEKAGLARLAHEEECGVVIFAGLPFSGSPGELPETLDKIDCPVLVHR